MKRTFKRLDGVEETLEGTAEELAEYERRIRESGRTTKSKPDVLKGKGLSEILKEIAGDESVKELIERLRPPRDPLWPSYPIWVVSCSICGRTDCNGYHGINPWVQPMQPYLPPGVTITWTGNAASTETLAQSCLDSRDS